MGGLVVDLDVERDFGRVPGFLEPEWDEDRRVDGDLDLVLDLVLHLEGRSFAFGRPDFPRDSASSFLEKESSYSCCRSCCSLCHCLCLTMKGFLNLAMHVLSAVEWSAPHSWHLGSHR